MSYSDHFKLVDDVLPHLEVTVASANDPFIQSRYVGLFAVSSAAVFELAVKQILYEFAAAKHDAFGFYCAESLKKLNGRIRLDSLCNEHVRRFGGTYSERLRSELSAAETRELSANRYSIKAAYEQIITWRHAFAHEGKIPEQATFVEAKKGYEAGKIVLSCLAAAMA